MSESEEKMNTDSSKDEEFKRVFASNLKTLMKERGYSLRGLAKELDVTHSAVAAWVNGSHLPRAGMLQRLTEVLLCQKTDLIRDHGRSVMLDVSSDTGNLEEQMAMFTGASSFIPVYDAVSCGQGGFIDEAITGSLKLPDDWLNASQEYFCNRAQGDSMEPLIQNGDYLIFEKSESVPPGRIGAFSLNGEYYCKRLKQFKDGSFWLFSDNEEYAPIPVKPEDDFRCLGAFSFKIQKVVQ